MAFLTYRQSDNTTTEAQQNRQDVVLGVPLSMYHVDANFKAVNDQIEDYKYKYGLSIANTDPQYTISSLYGINSANNIDSI